MGMIDRYIRAFFIGAALHVLENSWTDRARINGHWLRGRELGHPHAKAANRFLDSLCS